MKTEKKMCYENISKTKLLEPGVEYTIEILKQRETATTITTSFRVVGVRLAKPAAANATQPNQ